MHIRHLNIPNRQVAAFTLVELLTATAIMALVLVLLLQILNGILDSTRVQNQQMEAVGSARRVMDVIASDLRNAVISENSSILIPTAGSSNSFALLAARRGTNGATGHRYLAVRYSTNSSNQIIRSYGSSTFSGTNPLADAASAATITPVEPLARGQGRQETVGLAEEELDLGSGQFLDAGQVFLRPGVLFGHAGWVRGPNEVRTIGKVGREAPWSRAEIGPEPGAGLGLDNGAALGAWLYL
jgi:type II secretory pathway pseudopilin PulG